MTADGDNDGTGSSQPGFRYAAVLVLMFAAVVFLIAAAGAGWSRAVGLAIETVALVLTVATSRERESVRRRRALGIGVPLVAAVILTATGTAPFWLTAGAAVFVTAAVPFALSRGLLRLLKLEGVTASAVAGSLAIYLSTGLVFAWMISFVSYVGHSPYFAQPDAGGTFGDKVYFSFTVLTTTGFGDLTPATPVGHALAVIEMLSGQLYLVTVIGLLIGNFTARRRAA